MNESYSDITSKLGEPQWWDEAAVPRYCEFEPRRLAHVYLDEAALVEIECQGCGRTFPVAFSWGQHDGLFADRDIPSLAERIRADTLHYGDPPNYSCCPAGPTMNSIPRRVLQFWRKAENLFDFERVPELEVDIECKWARHNSGSEAEQ